MCCSGKCLHRLDGDLTCAEPEKSKHASLLVDLALDLIKVYTFRGVGQRNPDLWSVNAHMGL